ncbi:Helix-turn-helix domain-containing protein [Flavobacteriaceae bacterium MAR_2010_188]|nr:Helix-turn-helix domain-containing protein [Flavobacteriaceae bacterium MAR_2010_188]
MKKDLKFEDLPDAVGLLLQIVEFLEIELRTIKENLQTKVPLGLMKRNQVSQFFQINLATVHNWTKRGVLKSFGVGNRVYYKRKEIEDALVKLFR